MVTLNRIYTRGGDKGQTSLGDGSRVHKHSDRIEAIGSVDEANAFVGLAHGSASSNVALVLQRIQNDLFDLGADLSVPSGSSLRAAEVLRVTTDQVQWLEHTIDRFNRDLEPLTSFILPGGSRGSTYLHIARTIVRRAERHLAALQTSTPALKYLNRLSDLLFVLARVENGQGCDDVLSVPGAGRSEVGA